MGRLSENSVVNIKNKSHSVTAEIEVPDVGRRGRDHRAGRQHRRLEPLREGRQAQVLLQPARHPVLLRRVGRARSRPASTRCAWSSPTTAAAWARAARRRSSSTARRSARESRGHGGDDLLRRRRLRRRRGHRIAGLPGLRSARQRVQRPGQRGADRDRRGGRGPDHLVSPEDALRVAMARQ